MTKNREPEKTKVFAEGMMLYFEELVKSEKYGVSNNAINKAFNGQIIPFLSRCLSSSLTKTEFKQIVDKLLFLKLLPFEKRGLTLRFASIIVNSPNLFNVYRLLYSKLFIKLVLPFLSRS